MILDPAQVAAYLAEHGLDAGAAVDLEAVLWERDGTVEGRPVVMLAFRLPDGRRVLAKTTHRLFDAAASAFRGRLQYEAESGEN